MYARNRAWVLHRISTAVTFGAIAQYHHVLFVSIFLGLSQTCILTDNQSTLSPNAGFD